MQYEVKINRSLLNQECEAINEFHDCGLKKNC